jgi:hypothetical protein
MPQASLLVCERTDRWAVALRRALDRGRNFRFTLRELRSLAGCGAQLATEPASLVAVEVTAANLDAVLAALVTWQRRYPRCRLVALADESLAPAEHLLREAGAVAVLHSTREALRAVSMIERHAASSSTDNLPLQQAILGRLPWARGVAASA